MTEPATWMCVICGWIYDEAKGSPEHGIAPSTLWGPLSTHAGCPECGARHEDFEEVQA
ncbi:MAG: rubredoxin [Comamonadaceae bacterium]|nr:rubredoxin [Comamonadaceae bacterium]